MSNHSSLVSDNDNASGEDLVMSQEDLGIVHLRLPHLLMPSAAPQPPDKSGAGVGNLHLWLRFITEEQRLTLRGFIFFESAANPLNMVHEHGHHYRMPQAFWRKVREQWWTLICGGWCGGFCF